jgi:HAD superfamily hydrolase (TIGR01509 family)
MLRDRKHTIDLPTAAIFDIDGTLVDTNYQHALAWYRAFRGEGIVVQVWRIHRAIGIGSDRIVERLAGKEVEARCGDRLRDVHSSLYRDMLGEVEPMDGAHELLEGLHDSGHAIILASSAEEAEVEHYLELLDGRELVEGYTTSAEVRESKPEPDIVNAATAKAGTRDAVMIGDSTWDCKAAARAGVQSIGVLTGGFSELELRDAGAALVFESVEELRKNLGQTVLRD